MPGFTKTKGLIEDMVFERVVPGVNYALLKNGRTFRATIGDDRWLPQPQQLLPDEVYDLASLTKVLGTLNVALQLREAGQLSFNEPLQQFVPEFGDRRVRLFHLLTHTSGIKGWIPHRNKLTGDQLLRAIVKLPVTKEFNQLMRYADTNFILLGLALERILGAPIQNLVQERVLDKEPLKVTSYHPIKKNCVPTAFVGNQILQGTVHDPKGRQLVVQCGSAGLFSNMADLIALAKGYLGLAPENVALKQDTIAQLFDVKTPSGVQPRSWGWNLLFDPRWHYPLIYHTGFTGTMVIFDRVQKSALILLTNRVYPNGHNQLFIAMRSRIIKAFLQENDA